MITSRVKNVTISDITMDDVIVPMSLIGILINGVPGHPVENVQLQLPGGGTAENAKVQLAEKETAYPEFSMFGNTMPAYGLYLRHVRNLTLTNVHTTTLKPDARPETVRIDADETPKP